MPPESPQNQSFLPPKDWRACIDNSKAECLNLSEEIDVKRDSQNPDLAMKIGLGSDDITYNPLLSDLLRQLNDASVDWSQTEQTMITKEYRDTIKSTFERLMGEGYAEAEAKAIIAEQIARGLADNGTARANQMVTSNGSGFKISATNASLGDITDVVDDILARVSGGTLGGTQKAVPNGFQETLLGTSNIDAPGSRDGINRDGAVSFTIGGKIEF